MYVVEKLFDSFALSTPKGLQLKIWMDIMLHLIRRLRENQRQMTKDTFRIKVSALVSLTPAAKK